MLEGTLLWLVLALVLALWLPQNAAHEYAHVVTHRHWGAEITAFVVYPTNDAGKFSLAFWKDGFTWAHMSYRQKEPISDTAQGVCSIAPQFTNTVICSILLAIYWRFPDMPEVLASVLVAWYATNFIDGAFNLGTYYKWWTDGEGQTSDGWRFKRHWRIPTGVCRVGAVVWHVWFGFHLLIPPSWV